MNFDHYKSFDSEDFITDDNFIKLAKGNFVDGSTLDQLKSQLPEKSKEIDFAVEIINGLTTPKAGLSAERKTELLNRIFEVKTSPSRLIIFRYAAAVLLIAGLGVSGLYFFQPQNDIQTFASTSKVNSKNAELILADGKRIEIDSKQSKIEYTADGSSVSLNDTSKLNQSEPASGESFNQVIIPYGKRSNILLSDGSRVWLNSGSRLVYPPVFKGKNREVFLEGEAYFEVSKNAKNPFYVRTDAFRIKVLGTKFSVQAYKNEKEYNAVLVEGKVSLSKNEKFFSKEYELLPNQKASLSESENDFKISEVEDVQNSIAWIYGYMNFENENLVSITKRISRYYNVEIEIKTVHVGLKFSGKLDLKESPERILDGLSTIFKTKYEKQGNKFVFSE